MIRTHEEHLAHYGILRRSGRYPWGSGSTQNTRNRSFLDIIETQKKQGMSEAEIARGHGITTTELRAARSIAVSQQRQEKQYTAQRLKDKGWSNVKIGERMGLNESSVRALLAPGAKDKADANQKTAGMLKEQVAQKKYIDVGKGVEHHLGVTQTRLNTSIAVLKEQGYEVHNIKVQQIGTGKYTTMKVLAPPGTTLSELQRNRGEIKQITDYSEDNGRSWIGIQPPISISSRRVGINYKEDGGDQADGVIYVRPGAKHLDLGGNNYAQVRIAVDGTHYLKGMAVYKDDLPAGVDLVFNTNKSNTGRKKDAMKELSSDPDFPFGSIVRQIHGPDGKVSSAMNKVNEAGDWDKWSRNLSSQMLSKQSPELAGQQLKLSQERRHREFDEIMSLTNPTVRRDLLLRFADSTDAAAVHLKAASLPRQVNRVILPIKSINPKEVYAPGLRDGENVVLIRFPHGGRFEIPELKVNNRNPEARKILGKNALDAIGIHHTVAQHLSGADFDGDTVLVIPNTGGKVKKALVLEGLKNFDPHTYKIPKDSPIPRLTEARKGYEMGKISNLITDMTIHGANSEELSRAVRHSMVVIDASKHGLDHKQSEKDHGILSLKEKYQGRKDAGGVTIISRKKSQVHVPERIERPASKGGSIDPATGKKVFVPTGRMIPERKLVTGPDGQKRRVETGRLIPATQKSTRLAEADDAATLSSGTKMEALYVEHSNRLKALANTARKESLSVKDNPVSPSAKKVYANEVQSLTSKLRLAEYNAPLERQAQLLANTRLSQTRQANPHIEREDVKKLKTIYLNEARVRTKANKTRIIIEPKEWEAIQAGAISKDKLGKILTNSDADTVKRLAMPKNTPKMTSSMMVRAERMMKDGYTQQEVADHLGIGLTTLKVNINE